MLDVFQEIESQLRCKNCDMTPSMVKLEVPNLALSDAEKVNLPLIGRLRGCPNRKTHLCCIKCFLAIRTSEELCKVCQLYVGDAARLTSESYVDPLVECLDQTMERVRDKSPTKHKHKRTHKHENKLDGNLKKGKKLEREVEVDQVHGVGFGGTEMERESCGVVMETQCPVVPGSQQQLSEFEAAESVVMETAFQNDDCFNSDELAANNGKENVNNSLQRGASVTSPASPTVVMETAVPADDDERIFAGEDQDIAQGMSDDVIELTPPSHSPAGARASATTASSVALALFSPHPGNGRRARGRPDRDVRLASPVVAKQDGDFAIVDRDLSWVDKADTLSYGERGVEELLSDAPEDASTFPPERDSSSSSRFNNANSNSNSNSNNAVSTMEIAEDEIAMAHGGSTRSTQSNLETEKCEPWALALINDLKGAEARISSIEDADDDGGEITKDNMSEESDAAGKEAVDITVGSHMRGSEGKSARYIVPQLMSLAEEGGDLLDVSDALGFIPAFGDVDDDVSSLLSGWYLSLCKLRGRTSDCINVSDNAAVNLVKKLGAEKRSALPPPGQTCRSLAVEISLPTDRPCACTSNCNVETANWLCGSTFTHLVNLRWIRELITTRALPTLPPRREHAVCCARIRDKGVMVIPV